MRSLNKVELIGNVTRDPELRTTPSGTPVSSFTIATNRSWQTDKGDKHTETEFHNIVCWDKLAEISSKLLVKGTLTYIEGRLTTRKWKDKEGMDRISTEIVASDMIVLQSKAERGGE